MGEPGGVQADVAQLIRSPIRDQDRYLPGDQGVVRTSNGRIGG
jgi:hypothetical protein